MKTNTPKFFACVFALLFVCIHQARGSALAEAKGEGDVTDLKIESCSMTPGHISALRREETGVTYFFDCSSSVEVNLVIGHRTRVVVTYAGSLETRDGDALCLDFVTGFDREISYDDTINLAGDETAASVSLELGHWPLGLLNLWRGLTVFLEAEGVEQRGWGWTYYVQVKTPHYR